MMRYKDTIETSRLVVDVEVTTTTGDVEYPGTAVEVCDGEGGELLHVVVDSRGEQQVLIFPQAKSFRIPLVCLEKILARAREEVRFVPNLTKGEDGSAGK